MRFRALFGAVHAAILCVALFSGTSAAARPGIDVTASRGARPDLVASVRQAANDPILRRFATLGSLDERFGVPTMVWANRAASRAASAARSGPRPTAEQAARDHLARLAPYYRLDPADARDAALRYVHDTGRGGVIVAFRQEVGGIEVFRDEVKILMDRNLDLVSSSGYIPARAMAGAGAPAFRLPMTGAIERALEDFTGVAGGAGALRAAGETPGGYRTFELAGADALPGAPAAGQPIRSKQVLFHHPDRLEPAYYVEIMGETDAQAYVVSAADGGILFRTDLMADDAFTYRVWADGTSLHAPMDGPQGNDPTPHPTGVPDYYVPPYVSPILVTLQNGPISTNDPWLPGGATTTVGNNVDAYADISSPDGFGGAGDTRASTTAANTFDRAYDPLLAPGSSTNQRMAAIAQLFYTTNFLHDWFYDSGFDEASGNAQASNYGRGGLQGDVLKAEAQDYSGTNNANMATPADGASPRMQMYVFNTPGLNKVTVNSPPIIAGDMVTNIASWSPATFSITGNVVLVNDGSGTASDGCEPFLNSVAGKIALIDRGSCTFTSKAEKAQTGGAIGVIIVNNVPGDPPPLMGGTPSITITIGVLSISKEDGDLIKAQLGGGVNLTMTRGPEVTRDGTIDNMIVAHEWGHYISNRLVGNSGGLTTTQSQGLGEGWGDFHAMLMTVKPGDDFSRTFAAGYYAVGSLYGTNASYFGIRRVPYSTDFTKNALTFHHIENGIPLPAGVPTAFGSDGANNAEEHNAGEVWCTMLWECYAALLEDTGRLTFDEAQLRMRDYLVAAYKVTPLAPTFVEARDALLAAALANDPFDYAAFWQAFATRGCGMGAVAPDRYSTTNAGVVESYVVGGDLGFVSAAIADDVHSCDGDGYLDDGEIGNLVVTLKNIGALPLSSTTGVITSSNPAVSFLSGNTISFPPSSPNGTTSGSVQVLIQGAAGVETLDFDIDYDDTDLLVAGPRSQLDGASGNADEAASALETVEALSLSWTMTEAVGSTGAWGVRAIAPAQHRFFAPDPSSQSDLYLVTPPLQVAPAGNFTFTFMHAYSFEAPNWDGGVIEISINGGTSWGDIGSYASPGYSGVIYTGAGNPLSGRPAWVGQSGSFPSLSPVTVNLGTAYAGQTVLVRFRLGADGAAGAHGWELDDLQFSNLTNLPFLELTGDPDVCSLLAADASIPRDWSFAVTGANPARHEASFRFGLPAPARVAISIYDVTGRRVASVADGEFGAGTHTASWSAAPKAGVYFARMTANGREFMQRIVMLR